MSYFKLFFNVLKSHKINVILPLIILIVFSFVMVETINSNITQYKPYVYIVDKDNTELSKELVDEIEQHTKVKKYTGNEDIEEELMKSWVSLYIEVPEGFSENFNNYKNSNESKFKSKNKIVIKSIENSNSKVFIEEKINNFLNSKLNNIELDNNEFIKLEVSSAINTDDTSAKISAINFAAYAVIYGIPNIIGTFFMIIRRKNLKDRYTCGPVSSKYYLLQVIFASACVTILFALVVAIFILNIQFNISFGDIWLLNFVNIILMAILGIGLGLIYGMLVKNMEALTGISTGISLALAFLGGLFVPVEIFSNTMKKIAMFTPTYWYENVNTMINSGANNFNVSSILSSFGIQCIFIIVIFLLVAIINKKQQKNN